MSFPYWALFAFLVCFTLFAITGFYFLFWG